MAIWPNDGFPQWKMPEYCGWAKCPRTGLSLAICIKGEEFAVTYGSDKMGDSPITGNVRQEADALGLEVGTMPDFGTLFKYALLRRYVKSEETK